MKCGELDKGNLAQAYRNALETVKGAEVDIDVLAPHLKATGSSCGPCPALLTLVKAAFEAEQEAATPEQPIVINTPEQPVQSGQADDYGFETTGEVVRSALSEIIPGLDRLIPRGA